MSVFISCQDVRNNFVLEEIPCPECDEYIELFVRDGKTLGTEKCANCHYLICEGLNLTEIIQGHHGA